MLSVTIITLNEEQIIGKCIDSVKDIADEIILVDSKSTDKTVSIAKEMGCKVFVREFDNYANQKNYAASKAKNNWILSIDADETIEKELAREIKKKITNSIYDGFLIPRKNIILGKFIKYSRWQPNLDSHIWLWKKDKGKWIGDVHEELVVKGSVGRLKHAKIHNTHDTISKFWDMMDRYSEIDANKLVKQGKKFSLFQLIFQPSYNFLVRYFYRFGFLDGWRGFVLSYLMTIYHFQVWVKLWREKDV